MLAYVLGLIVINAGKALQGCKVFLIFAVVKN